MTDKEYEKQKARVKKYIDKWFDSMGLNWYKVEMVWNRARNEDLATTAARTITTWQYRTAEIEWFLPGIADCDNDFLEGIVIHEFVHILVAPMMLADSEDGLKLQHEYATECIARAMQWVREAGENKGAPKKKAPSKTKPTKS